MSWLDTISINVLQPTLWGASLLFVICYTLLQPWWRHALGTTLVILDSAWCLALTPGMCTLVFHTFTDTFAWQLYTLVVLSLAPLSIIWRLIILGMASHWRFRLPWNHPAAATGNGAAREGKSSR